MKETGRQDTLARKTIERLRALAVAGVFAAAAALSACGGDSSSTPAGPVVYTTPVGSYDVSTVNAKALPVAIYSAANYTYEVMSGTLVLTADGKYSITETFRQTVAGKVDLFVDSTGGTWVLSGSSVNFVNGQDGSTDKADWANTGTLTFVEAEGTANNTYLYKIRK